jgi:FdhE protein
LGFMTKDAWLTKHSYLHGIADLQKAVDDTVAKASIPIVSVPPWNDYVEDFHAGIPLLLSSAVEIDLAPAESAFTSVADTLASKPLPQELASATKDLISELQKDSDLPRQALDWLLLRSPFTPKHAGLVQYIGWTVIARYLHRLVAEFHQWRDEERWLLAYCPTCGAPPAMAQRTGGDPIPLRFLSCCCCRTRWRYMRTGCPFCETKDDHQLAVLAIEGEDALRIEYCHSCGGYLKTYTGQGSEHLLLSDWTSLHLDLIAGDRGFKRYARSLYNL